MFFLLITNGLDVLYPFLLKVALDQIASEQSQTDIFKTSALLLLVMSGLALTRYLWRTFFGKYHIFSAEDLRRRMFAQLTQLSPQFYSKSQTGELMNLMTSDVQSFRMAIGSGVLILVDGITIMLMVLPMMIYLNWEWTWKTLILLPLIPFLIYVVNTQIQRRYKLAQERLGELSGLTQESVMGIRVTKAFAQEPGRLKKFETENQKYLQALNHAVVPESLFGPVMQFGVASGTVILLFTLSSPEVLALTTLGTFIAFQRYIAKMTWPMMALGLGLS